MAYFSGWYYKCQSNDKTLAIIDACHNNSKSIQIITDNGVYYFNKNLDKCYFSDREIRLDLNENGVHITGDIIFGEFTKIKYDIMGPFKYVPFMQCRHSVKSMRHKINGKIYINNEEYDFSDSLCYIEGDRGYSFPKQYLWTHCFINDGSIMLSVADIPFLFMNFIGIIGVVFYKNKEYRIATYLGAKVTMIGDGYVKIKQGKFTLIAKLIEKNSFPLNAPENGVMERTIHESASCKAEYAFYIENNKIFDEISDKASFEFEFFSR